MAYFVVFLESKRWIVVRKQWIQNPNCGQKSAIFYTQNQNSVANFDAPTGFYLNERSECVYNAFIWREFGKYYMVLYYA